MPPLKEYTVKQTKQEVRDLVAQAVLVKSRVKLKLIASDGNERTVTFRVESYSDDTLSELIIGTTTHNEAINVLMSTNDTPTAQLRT